MSSANETFDVPREVFRLQPEQLMPGDVYGFNAQFRSGYELQGKPVRVLGVTLPRRFSLSGLTTVEFQLVNEHLVPVDERGAYEDPQMWRITAQGLFRRKKCGDKGRTVVKEDGRESIDPVIEAYFTHLRDA